MCRYCYYFSLSSSANCVYGRWGVVVVSNKWISGNHQGISPFLEVGKAIVGKFSIVFFAHFFPWEFVGRRPVVCLNKKCDLCPLPSPLCWPLQRKERKKTEMLKNCFPPLLSHKKDGALRLSRKVQKTCSERVPKIQRLISRVFILFRVLNN